MAETPAPRPQETNPLIAPDHMPLIDNGLTEALGVIPGETPSEKVKLEDDFGENYPAARGCLPGSRKKVVEIKNIVTAQNIPTKYNRSKILMGAQIFEDPFHSDLIRVD